MTSIVLRLSTSRRWKESYRELPGTWNAPEIELLLWTESTFHFRIRETNSCRLS